MEKNGIVVMEGERPKLIKAAYWIKCIRAEQNQWKRERLAIEAGKERREQD